MDYQKREASEFAKAIVGTLCLVIALTILYWLTRPMFNDVSYTTLLQDENKGVLITTIVAFLFFAFFGYLSYRLIPFRKMFNPFFYITAFSEYISKVKNFDSNYFNSELFKTRINNLFIPYFITGLLVSTGYALFYYLGIIKHEAFEIDEDMLFFLDSNGIIFCNYFFICLPKPRDPKKQKYQK